MNQDYVKCRIRTSAAFKSSLGNAGNIAMVSSALLLTFICFVVVWRNNFITKKIENENRNVSIVKPKEDEPKSNKNGYHLIETIARKSDRGFGLFLDALVKSNPDLMNDPNFEKFADMLQDNLNHNESKYKQ